MQYAASAERLPKARRPLPLLHQQQRVLNNPELPVACRQHHLCKTQFHRLLATAVNMLFALELLFAFLLPLVAALKFDIQAHPGHESASKERCIRNFVAKDQLVVVTATVSGSRGDGQTLNMHIKDAVGNDYGRPRDVVGESRHAFHAHEDSAFDVCFENILTATHAIADPYRNVELDIDIGADAKDWNAIQAGEKLKPVEAELKRVSEVASEIVAELDYLRGREIRLRDTNESTNERVKWFAIGTMGMLMALGAWQIVYLRAYFRSKHLI
ncbi:hypothetical protein Q7P35_004973 [Cladosporium inversicolor]